MLRPETALARNLRRGMTLPEILVWQRLKGGASGLKFRRQHPIGPYVVNRYCNETRTVIEIDGEIHGRGRQPARDALRDTFLRDNGFRIVHMNAADVLRDADAAAASIAALAAAPLHHAFGAVPLPASGEE